MKFTLGYINNEKFITKYDKLKNVQLEKIKVDIEKFYNSEIMQCKTYKIEEDLGILQLLEKEEYIPNEYTFASFDFYDKHVLNKDEKNYIIEDSLYKYEHPDNSTSYWNEYRIITMLQKEKGYFRRFDVMIQGFALYSYIYMNKMLY